MQFLIQFSSTSLIWSAFCPKAGFTLLCINETFDWSNLVWSLVEPVRSNGQFGSPSLSSIELLVFVLKSIPFQVNVIINNLIPFKGKV